MTVTNSFSNGRGFFTSFKCVINGTRCDEPNTRTHHIVLWQTWAECVCGPKCCVTGCPRHGEWSIKKPHMSESALFFLMCLTDVPSSSFEYTHNLWRSNRLFATEGEKKINQIHIDDSITHCYVIKYSIVNYLLIRIFLLLLLQMSHLYSMFAKDVSKYCKSNSDAAAKCKRDMLSFGVTKLEKMSESHLDAMDPFQRSASDISKCLFPFNFIIYWGFQ